MTRLMRSFGEESSERSDNSLVLLNRSAVGKGFTHRQRKGVIDASSSLRSSQPMKSPALLVRHLLSDYPKACCLDGSPAAYYHRPGFGSGINKWYIFHQGGGWCGPSLEDCWKRSKTELGSSTSYPPTMDYNGEFLSTDPVQNPLTYNWNQVVMKYCDGGSFAGNNDTATYVSFHDHGNDGIDKDGDDLDDATKNSTTRLYFAGKHILKAVQKDLEERYQLGTAATDLVVSGCSAGGLATLYHCDDWASQLLNEDAKVVCVPQSGLFLDNTAMSGSYYPAVMKFTFMQQNISIQTTECYKYHAPLEAFKCMFAENIMQYIKTPVFALQSRFDSWQIDNDLQSHDAAMINAWGNRLTHVLFEKLLFQESKHGAFVDSCIHHCGGWDIVIDGAMVIEATKQWYDNIQNNTAQLIWLQDRAYPNSCATPFTSTLLQASKEEESLFKVE
jgi:hypothetical protein